MYVYQIEAINHLATQREKAQKKDHTQKYCSTCVFCCFTQFAIPCLLHKGCGIHGQGGGVQGQGVRGSTKQVQVQSGLTSSKSLDHLLTKGNTPVFIPQ